MAIPQIIYVYQEQNNIEAPYRVALTLDEIPNGTRVGVFQFLRLVTAVHTVTEG